MHRAEGQIINNYQEGKGVFKKEDILMIDSLSEEGNLEGKITISSTDLEFAN